MTFKNRLFIVSNIWLFTVFFAVQHNAFAVEKDTGNLGEIRQSILSVEDFQRIYGVGWVLMAGQPVEDSDLFRERLWTSSTLPDARGIFLRSANHGRANETGNPAGNLPLGEYQADQVIRHVHQITGPEGGRFFVSTAKDSCELRIGLTGGTNFADLGGCLKGITRDFPTPFGGSETRPRNIIVNTFIKINRTPDNDQTLIFTETLQALPQRLLENQRLREVIREMVREETSRLR